MSYYQKYGQGQAVILLHSGGMAGEEWKPQLESLAARYQVFVPDLLGHGKSVLAQGERTSIAQMGKAIIAMMDAENISSANLCGSSLGGAVALWITLHFSARVKRLVVYRMTYRTNPVLYQETQAMSDPNYWQKFRLEKWLAKLHAPQGGAEAWREVIARVSDVLDPAHSDHCHTLEALQKITCPTLLIAGDRDPVAPLEEIILMQQTIPDAGLWILPFTDHITATNTWRAAAMAEELRRFFSG